MTRLLTVLWKRIRNKKFPAYKVGTRNYRVNMDDIKKYMARPL